MNNDSISPSLGCPVAFQAPATSTNSGKIWPKVLSRLRGFRIRKSLSPVCRPAT